MNEELDTPYNSGMSLKNWVELAIFLPLGLLIALGTIISPLIFPGS